MTTGLSTTPSAASLLKTSSGEKVREKFLNMIGIEAKLPPAGAPACNRNTVLARNKMQTNNHNHSNNNNDDHSTTNEQAVDPSASQTWVNPRTQNVVCFTESLKYDRDADRMFSSKRRKLSADSNPSSPSQLSSSSESSSSCSNGSRSTRSNRKGKKSLMFGDTVMVVPIPMRNEYSNRVRHRLWSNAMEIYENAARNAYEFAAEGWDWRTVIEDEGMYVCAATGELIHPCHYESQARE